MCSFQNLNPRFFFFFEFGKFQPYYSYIKNSYKKSVQRNDQKCVEQLLLLCPVLSMEPNRTECQSNSIN